MYKKHTKLSEMALNIKIKQNKLIEEPYINSIKNPALRLDIYKMF